ncbi:MAG: hypothetical protein O7D91_21135 [Planctomycetota bacterium]|nr:hypothetical protein [Planctomycetota bacterium]
MSPRTSAVSLALLLCSCTGSIRSTSPIDSALIGTVDEPVSQQMRRRLMPPFQTGLDGDEIAFPFPAAEGPKPFPVKTIVVLGRTSDSISLRWHDRSGIEAGTRVRRREATGGWVNVDELGPLSGFQDWTNTGLSPDSLYCYQFIAFNEYGDSYSPQACAYTRGAEEDVIFRAQLVVKTADVSDAGTDDDVRVRLNSPPGTFSPSGNVTDVDYGRDDFERGDSFIYDLELTGLTRLTDVTLINLSKTGSNGWCVEELSLLINNESVYSESFGPTNETCLWLDNSGPYSRNHSIFHEKLRDHVLWQNFTQRFPQVFVRREIESRIEGMVGHLIAGDSRIKWGDRNGRAWVEATRRNQEMVHIDLDLEGVVSWWFNPSVDIDFDVTFRLTLRGDVWQVDITASNLEADVDFDWFSKTLSFILPCGPVVSIAEDEGIPDCIAALEKYIEDKILSGWQPIAEHFLVGTPCRTGFHPVLTVNEGEHEGELESVSVDCAVDDAPPTPAVRVSPSGVIEP